MPRVATCNDCRTQFRVPDTTTATRARCKKCGGVVEIPPASGEAGQPASTTGAPPARAAGSAPRRAAEASRAAVAASSSAAPVPTRRKAGAAAAGAGAPAAAPRRSKSTGTSGAGARRGRAEGSRSARRGVGSSARAGAGRRGRGEKGEKAEKTGLGAGVLVGIVVVVLLGAAAAWWFLRDRGTETVAPTAPASTSPASPQESGGAAPPGPGERSGDAPPPSEPLQAGTAGAPSEPPEATATPAAPATPEEVEPLSTVIEFDPVPPVPGTTEEQLSEWTELVRELYLLDGGATGRSRKRLQERLDAVDPIDAIPAYLNALNGLDLGSQESVRTTWRLVTDWQEDVAYVPRFSYPGDETRMDPATQNLRVSVLLGWNKWWVQDRKAGADPDLLQDYREKVEAARQQAASKPN